MAFLVFEVLKCQLYLLLLVVGPVVFVTYSLLLVTVLYQEENRWNPFFGLKLVIHTSIVFIIYWWFFHHEDDAWKCVL
jgi:hypothetical protein